ncbi:MAG: 30S ribosomal protein S9 [Vampirovibrionales bacterium]
MVRPARRRYLSGLNALAIELPDLAKLLKDGGYLTRDARVKERKKYGLHSS